MGTFKSGRSYQPIQELAQQGKANSSVSVGVRGTLSRRHLLGKAQENKILGQQLGFSKKQKQSKTKSLNRLQ